MTCERDGPASLAPAPAFPVRGHLQASSVRAGFATAKSNLGITADLWIDWAAAPPTRYNEVRSVLAPHNTITGRSPGSGTYAPL